MCYACSMNDTHFLCCSINADYLVIQAMKTTNLNTYCSR